MANTIPLPQQPVLFSQTFQQKWLARFADNEYQNITEGTFREFVNDLGVNFAVLGDLTTNQVKGSVFRVPYIELVNGLPTVPTALVPPAYRILAMEAVAVNGTDASTALAGVRADPISFKLVANSQGTVNALLDEKPTTTATVKAAWVRTSGTDAQKVASYLPLPLEDAPLKKGEVYQYTFTDLVPPVTRLFEVRNDLNQFQNPLPTGLDSDPNYKPFAPLTAASAYDDTAVQGLIAALATGKVEVWAPGPKFANRTYLLVDGIGPGLFRPKNDIGNSQSVSLPFYDRVADFRFLPASDLDTLVAALQGDLDYVFTLIDAINAKLAGLANSDRNAGAWNAQTNQLVVGGQPLAESTGANNTERAANKGRYFVVLATTAPFATTAVGATNGTNSLLTVASTAGIGVGHAVSGPGIAPNTRVVSIFGGGVLTLNTITTVADGAALTFTPSWNGITQFYQGDLLYSDGAVYTLRPGLARVLAGGGGATTVSAEHYTATVAGAQPAIVKPGAVFFFDVSVNGQALVQGQDYTVNAATGTLQVLAAAGVQVGEEVTYSWFTTLGTVVPAADEGIDFEAEHNGVSGFSDQNLPLDTQLLAVREPYNASLWRWQLLRPDGTALGPVRTSEVDCNADFAAARAATPAPAYLRARHEVVRSQNTDVASYTFPYRPL